MGLIGFLWFVVGIVSLVGFVWLCVQAFKQHVGWGLAVFFLSPIAAIVFAVKHWQQAKKPFLIYAGSTVAFFVLVIAAFTTMGGFQMMSMAHRMSQGEEISDEEAAEFMQAQIERMESSGMLSPEEEAELRKMQEMVKGMQQSQVDSAQQNASTITLKMPSTSDEGTVSAEAASPQTPRAPSTSSRRSKQSSALLPSGDPVPPGYKLVAVRDADRYVGHTVKIFGKNGSETKGLLADADSRFLLVQRHLSSGTISFELSTSEVDSLLIAYR